MHSGETGSDGTTVWRVGYRGQGGGEEVERSYQARGGSSRAGGGGKGPQLDEGPPQGFHRPGTLAAFMALCTLVCRPEGVNASHRREFCLGE